MRISSFQRATAQALSSVSLSRHTAVPILRRVVRTNPLSNAGQVTALLCGSTLIGLAVSLLVRANLGLPPYDVLSSALRDHLGLSLGQSGWLIAAVLLMLSAVLGRRPSAWSIGYIVANGLAIDAVSEVLNTPTTLLGRVLYVASGIIVMALAVNVVVFSGTTGGAFELLMLAGEDRGVSRVAVRYVLDIGVFLVGLALGGNFGLATIAFALTFGFVFHHFDQAFTDHREGRAQRVSAGPRYRSAVEVSARR